MKQIKVVQIIPRLDEGGAERGTADLVREHRGAAQHAVISEGGRLAPEIEAAGGRFLSLPVASKNPLTAPRRALLLRRALAEIEPDIVHVRSRVPAWLHYFANRSLGIPTVATAHGINSVNWYSRIMVRADMTICPGNAAAEHLRRAYGAQNVVVIERGIDAAYFDPQKADLAAAQQLRATWGMEDKTVLLHAGRLSEQKGHEVLLHALSMLPSHYGAVIAGGGRRLDRLQTLARRLGVDDRAHFAGALSGMREAYAAADVVLSCAVKPESFGRTVAEALAMQKPVIAAAHGGALDIIGSDERAGALVTPGSPDALAKAVIAAPEPDPESRGRILARFTAARMAARTLEVYREVLARREAPAPRNEP